MHRPRRRLLLALGAAGCLAAVAPWRRAAAATFAEGAGHFIKSLADRAIAVLDRKNQTIEQREVEFRRLFLEGFDLPTIGRFVLGRYWERASEGQRAQFLKAFEDLTVRSYALRFDEYSGEKLVVLRTREDRGTVAFVESQIVRPGGGAPLKVEWRVEQYRNGTYKIMDIVVESVSLALTQRSEYSAVIQARGGKLEGLIEALNEKFAVLDKLAKDRGVKK